MPARRTAAWYEGTSRDTYIHTAWMRRGLPDDAFTGKPMIAICNTASEISPCNAHLTQVSAAVKQGIWAAGGVPLDMPVISLGETQMRPTAMLFRNLAAMAAEELIRANPIDGVVLLGGCDKTVPSLIMGAASVNLPAIMLNGGPMLTGTFRGHPLGCGTDVWRWSEEARAGKVTNEEFAASQQAMIRSAGHCNTMGTASTMGIMAEALGMTLPGSAGVPAPDARLLKFAHATGQRIVEMVEEDLKPSDILKREAFLNAIVALATVGGSTNAVPHLLAIAGRVGADLKLTDFDEHGSHLPLLANLQPAGTYLMEDLFRAGGLLAALNQVRDLLSDEAITVSGKPLSAHLDGAEIFDTDVIHTRDNPVQKEAGIAVLHGNLAPTGAIIKPAAASPELLQHRGRAVVFENIEDLHARIDDPDLDIDETCIIVLRGAGPKGYPGMPEVSNTPLPTKVLEKGVRDMVRVCDGRMSGTAYGTVVLHVSPEAAAGGPLGKVRNGDYIVLDVPGRRLYVDMPDDDLNAREVLPETEATFARPARGYERLYIDHVTQADTGADLDFLVGSSGSAVGRESH